MQHIEHAIGEDYLERFRSVLATNGVHPLAQFVGRANLV
jgi:hypothetical protein